MKLREKLSWALVAVLGLFVAASLTSVVSGGTLDPPGPPAPSLRPLDEVLSAWSTKLSSDDTADPCQSSRFSCVLDNAGVLDRETGLVWERVVSTSLFPFGNARGTCLAAPNGGRLGWRLPTTTELTSLIDANAAQAPYLPAGHPFVTVSATAPYWTSTPLINPSTGNPLRELVYFDFGLGAAPETVATARYWCVRGGQGPIE